MSSTKRISLVALFLALGLILPFITMQIPEFGQMLTPMHFPVIIAAIVLGSYYGAVIGFITPLLRLLLFGLPLFPMAMSMSFELAVYGLVVGLIIQVLSKTNLHRILNVVIALVIAIILGRITFSLAAMIFMNVPRFMTMFITTFTGSFIGIILQLILIPLIMIRLYKHMDQAK